MTPGAAPCSRLPRFLANPRALPQDWALTRERWNAANLWRAWASAAAFALALAALALRAAQAFRLAR